MALGLAVAAVSAGFIVLELLLLGALAWRLWRRLGALSRLLEEQLDLTEAEYARLQQALAETRGLLRPYRRAWRWLRHPLVQALLASYRRRRQLARIPG